MQTKSHLVSAILSGLLVVVFTVPAQSQGRGRQVTLPDGSGKELNRRRRSEQTKTSVCPCSFFRTAKCTVQLAGYGGGKCGNQRRS